MSYIINMQHHLLVALLFVFCLIDSTSNVTAQTIRLDSMYSANRALLPNFADSARSKTMHLLELAESTSNQEYIAKSYYLLGVIHYFKAEYYISQNYYQKALKTEYVKQDSVLREYIWNNIGINYDKTENIVQSLQAYQQSLQLAEKRNDSTSINETKINIGLLLVQQQKIDAAISITNEALSYFKRTNDAYNMALCYQNLAKYESEKGNYILSESYMKQALSIFTNLDDTFSQTKLLYNLAVVYIDMRNFKTAQDYLIKSKRIAQKMGLQETVFDIYLKWALIRIHQNLFKEAELYLDSALTVQQTLEVKRNNDLYLDYRKTLYAKSGDYLNYSQFAQQYTEEIKRQYQKKTSSVFEEMLVVYNQDKIVAENAELANKLTIQDLELSNQRLWNFILLSAVLGTLLLLIILVVFNRRNTRLTALLTEKNNQLSELNSFRNEIMGIIGHDMGNLIAPLSGFLKLFNHNDLEYETFKQIAPDLEENADQIELMFVNLQKWSDTQREGFTVHPKQVHVRAVFEELASLYKAKCITSSIHLTIQCTDNCQIIFDEEQFRHTIRNLIHNALKFTPQGGFVTVICEQINQDNTIIKVTDTGIGMNGETVQQLLYTDNRLTRPGVNKERGSGLGLSVCKKFLAANKTTLQIESEIGKGSSFFFFVKSVN